MQSGCVRGGVRGRYNGCPPCPSPLPHPFPYSFLPTLPPSQYFHPHILCFFLPAPLLASYVGLMLFLRGVTWLSSSPATQSCWITSFWRKKIMYYLCSCMKLQLMFFFIKYKMYTNSIWLVLIGYLSYVIKNVKGKSSALLDNKRQLILFKMESKSVIGSFAENKRARCAFA